MARQRPDKDHQRKTALYQRFIAEIGVTTPELQALFAEEARNLSREDVLVLKGSDFFAPATWTPQQTQVFTKMLARAAATAKRRSMAA